MDPQQIKAFIDAMAASDLDEMEVSHAGWTLRLVRRAAGPGAGVAAGEAAAAAVGSNAAATAAAANEAAAAAAGEAPAAATSGTGAAATPAAQRGGAEDVRAPMFGIVHLQKAPGEPPCVQVGDAIEAGQLLCTIEAMKVFNEVRAERAGRVAAVLVASGLEVEAGHPLMRLEPAAHV